MELLKEIFHQQDLKRSGKIIFREAVRGIIIREGQLWLIYSSEMGDYKFPGGGVDDGESHEETLRREIREESGATLLSIEKAFGKIIEYALPVEADYDVFKMTSSYYICHIDDLLFQEPRLDRYERDLGFTPVWVDIETAINTNKAMLRSDHPQMLRWIGRETFVLEQVKAKLFE